MKNYCKACHSKTSKVINVCKTPLCDLYTNKKNNLPIKYSLNIFFCENCKLIQLDDIVQPDKIYKKYIYKSSHSVDLKEHFKRYSQRVIKLGFLNKHSKILDIGCNDGTFLNFFKKKKYDVMGIDPAPNIVKECKSKSINLINNYFNDSVVKNFKKRNKKFDIIFSNNTIANIPKLKKFFQNINKVLSDNGTFIFETINGPNLISDMQIDMLNNEHIYYFSVIAVKRICELNNLKLIFLEKVKTKGGSYRFYIKKKSSKFNLSKSNEKLIGDLIKSERRKGFFTKKGFRSINNKYRKRREKLANFLKKFRHSNLSAYGASGPATSMIYFYKLQNKINYLIDDNPLRIDRYSPGASIRVLSSKELLKLKTKFVIILAWRFTKEIVSRNKSYLKQGGKFICIHPKIKII